MLKLDNRLQMLYNMVRPKSKIVDVGTDHGYLISKLILDNKCTYGKCVDINEKCLKKAQKLAKEYGITDNIKFSNSNGLQDVLPEEADDIVIAGMGSELIINIIKNCNWLKKNNGKYLILQPMKKPWLLREYLYNNGFTIIDENLTYSKKFFYVAIGAKFCANNKKISDVDKIIGLLLKKPNEYTQEYISYISNKINCIAEKILVHEKDEKKYNYYQNLYCKLNNIIAQNIKNI